MLRGKKVCLQPNKKQEEMFFVFSGTSRFAWNESLAYYERMHEETGEYARLRDLMKHLQQLKHEKEEYSWLNEVPEAITKQAMKDLLKAFKSFYDRRRTEGYDPKEPGRNRPKFKKKGKCQESFYQRTDNIHKTDDSHVKITGIRSPVKCKGLRGISLPERIQNPRISYDGKYWYLSYSYETEEEKMIPEREAIGIDLGISEYAVTSDGVHYGNINKRSSVKKLRKRLKRLQRDVSRKYEKNCTSDDKGRKRYHKTNNIRRKEKQIQLAYRRIRNIQKTYMYEVVKSVMRTKPQMIVMEDLDVKGMMQDPKIARHLQKENLSEFRRILTYKCEQKGIGLITADRWYPSSRKCSHCGSIKHDLKLSDRTYVCDRCGMIMDRDENAAVNLERYPEITAAA
jgi:putative transposase